MNEQEFQQWLAQAVLTDADQFEAMVKELARIARDVASGGDPHWVTAAQDLGSAGRAVQSRWGN